MQPIKHEIIINLDILFFRGWGGEGGNNVFKSMNCTGSLRLTWIHNHDSSQKPNFSVCQLELIKHDGKVKLLFKERSHGYFLYGMSAKKQHNLQHQD